MDINKLDQTSRIDKIAKTSAERERVAAFKAVAKQEKNFAELIKQKEKLERHTKIKFDESTSIRVSETIETAYDKDGNLLFEKSRINRCPKYENDLNTYYYEYIDKKTGNQVFFADFDNDGKMDYVTISYGDNFSIEGYDTDDDGIFDEVKYLDSNKNFIRKADDPVQEEKGSSNNIERKENVDDGKLAAQQKREVVLDSMKNRFKKDVKKLIEIIYNAI